MQFVPKLDQLEERFEALTQQMADAAVIGIMGISIDISQRKAAERDLKRILAAIDLAQDWIIVTDAGRRIVYANQTVLTGAGIGTITLADVRGKQVIDFQSDPAFHRQSEAFDAEVVHRHMRPDGKVAHAALRIGNSTLMLGELPPGRTPMLAMLYFYVADCDATYRRAISANR